MSFKSSPALSNNNYRPSVIPQSTPLITGNRNMNSGLGRNWISGKSILKSISTAGIAERFNKKFFTKSVTTSVGNVNIPNNNINKTSIGNYVFDLRNPISYRYIWFPYMNSYPVACNSHNDTGNTQNHSRASGNDSGNVISVLKNHK